MEVINTFFLRQRSSSDEIRVIFKEAGFVCLQPEERRWMWRVCWGQSPIKESRWHIININNGQIVKMPVEWHCQITEVFNQSKVADLCNLSHLDWMARGSIMCIILLSWPSRLTFVLHSISRANFYEATLQSVLINTNSAKEPVPFVSPRSDYFCPFISHWPAMTLNRIGPIFIDEERDCHAIFARESW